MMRLNLLKLRIKILFGHGVLVASLYRWLKYEERVEIGERWSKPHVSTTSLRGLQMFRDALIQNQCCVGLDQIIPSGDHEVAGNSNN